MREHKFRAWDKKRKEWLGVNLHMSVVDGLLWWQFGFGCKPFSIDECGDIELVQYIGQKDKSNKRIFEGHVLKDNYGRILLVEWYKHGFCFKALRETNFVRARDISQWFENGEKLPEIIGNMFENPELIKEEKP